jgi:hypothetical protein
MNAQTPFDLPEAAIQEAFNIAMRYLQFTGQAEPLGETQQECSRVIVEEWRNGKRHPIWLANKGIKAIEEKVRQRTIDSTTNATVVPIH